MAPPTNNQLVKITLTSGRVYPGRYFEHHARLGGQAGYEARTGPGMVTLVPAAEVAAWEPDGGEVAVGYGPGRFVSQMDLAMAMAMMLGAERGRPN